MLIKSPAGWEIPERLATPEDVVLDRRTLLVGAGSIAAAGTLPRAALAASKPDDPTADLYPAKRDPRFEVARAITPERINATYNNFFEFGTHKKIYKAAQALPIRPWEVTIDGDVETPFTIGIDDLIRKLVLEERLYRHRCVEGWSMTVPWTGFPMKELVRLAKPLSKAGYVRMETFLDPGVARRQRASWYPWPYAEGLTIAEATNDLAFLVTGAYGKPLAKQFGAPLRLAVPWKYGFKSIKSVVRFTFTSKRPRSFWEVVQGSEFGFWANINPKVDHPRRSQATERLLGTGEDVPTRLFNGYGPFVAKLYEGLEGEKLYM